MTRQRFLPAKGLLSARTFPLTSDLKLAPFERFHEARGFDEWQENRSWTLGPASAQVGKFMKSLQDYPPPTRAASFELDVDELLRSAQQSGSC